jgi:hypothetical protein
VQEREVYTRPEEGLIRLTPRISALARKWVGQDAKDIEAIHRLWFQLLDTVWCGVIHYDQVDARAPSDWVLDHGIGDCQLASALFIALCRAEGIPARLVGGNLLYGRAPTNHFWAEAWSDEAGWQSFDFLAWDLSEGGRNPQWRQHFAGTIDPRLRTQCFPLSFTGPMSVRFPEAWHMVQEPAGMGVRTTFLRLDGSLIYSDMVERLRPAVD